MRKIHLILALPLALAACNHEEPTAQSSGDVSFEAKLQQQLLDAKPGSVIDIPAGHYHLQRGLSLRTDGVTIKGAGMDKTVLSFKGQVVGPEGLLVNANDFTIENLALEDTKGDALKINQGKNITIRGVRVEWTGETKTTNGAYGLYPVKTQNVLVEDSVVIGASDAGIYVGQSNNIVVRRNRAEYNVAGIEIENSVNADVYENTATNNTGGILVFNMPNLSQAGHSTRVFKNKTIGNNTDNFAAKGAAVASVPRGSGVVVNSNDKVEIFDNDIADNQTANVIISSYYTNYYNTKGVAADYNPYPKGVFIYDNRFKGGGDSPDGLKLKTLKTAVFGLSGKFPDILWDGYVDQTKLVDGLPPDSDRFCIQNGDVGVINADGPHDYKNPSTDTKPYQCTLPKLPPVVLDPETESLRLQMMKWFVHVGVLLALMLLSACHRGLDPVAFQADGRPPKLSDWHVVEVRDGALVLNQGVVPYDLNTPLFTDYAHKLRTIWMPKGVSAKYDPSDTFDFPVGTIISKTFYYPRAADGKVSDVARTYDSSHDFAGEGLDLAHVHLIETRILVRREAGWAAIPYVWKDDQSDALLARTGTVIPLTLVDDSDAREDFNYVVPDESQCASCHAQDWVTRKIHPIGPKARHLNRDYHYAASDENELAHLAKVGYLTGAPAAADAPRNANWMDERASLDARARAYLDINCGHCHNPKGAANTTGMTLDVSAPEDRHLGICKPPVAAGRGTGDHLFDVVPGQPDDSILPYRMHSADPGVMMPELGRSTVHREGVALIKAWIAAQSGGCVAIH